MPVLTWNQWMEGCMSRFEEWEKENRNMPETMDFAEALAYLKDGGIVAGPGLPTRGSSLVLEQRDGVGTLIAIYFEGYRSGVWQPKPLNLVRNDWRVAGPEGTPLPSSDPRHWRDAECPTDEQKAILDIDHRVDAIETALHRIGGIFRNLGLADNADNADNAD